MGTVLKRPTPHAWATGFDDFTLTDQEAYIEVRHAAWFGLRRTFEISIDGCPVGQVGKNSPGSYRVLPGRHAMGARMDWVRSQTVFICLDADERVVFRCCMERLASRLYATTSIGLAVGAIAMSLARVLPSFISAPLNLVGVCGFCLGGVCELGLFSRMMPWSAPGRIFRLFRYSVESNPRESR